MALIALADWIDRHGDAVLERASQGHGPVGHWWLAPEAFRPGAQPAVKSVGGRRRNAPPHRPRR